MTDLLVEPILDDELLQRCDDCAFWQPVTPFAAGLQAHTSNKHNRAAYDHERLPRTAADLHAPVLDDEAPVSPSRHAPVVHVVIPHYRGGGARMVDLL